MNDTITISIDEDPRGVWGISWELECHCSLDAMGNLESVDQVIPTEGTFWANKRGIPIDMSELTQHDHEMAGLEIARQFDSDIREAVQAEIEKHREAAPYTEAERRWERSTGR